MPKLAVVITAGGNGSRMGSIEPKQFLSVCGKPLFLHTLDAFQSSPDVDAIVITLPNQFLNDWSIETLQELSYTKVLKVVAGGPTRQASVFEGLKALVSYAPDFVLIHDAARCLITQNEIHSVCEKLMEHDGVILGLPVRDTLKRIDQSHKITATIPRQELWAMQTPQGFQYDFLWTAFRKALEAGFEGTDDASVAEFFGGNVCVVEGLTTNIKVTYPEDLFLAEKIFEYRRNS